MAIHTEVEIDRSPEQVRKTVSCLPHTSITRLSLTPSLHDQFLDFPSYSTWTHGFIKSITPADPTVAPGTKLRNVLQGMTISPTIMANSPQEFRWRGVLWGIPGLFTGEHQFRFEPSKITPGGTTFVQAEKFSGILTFMIAEGTGFWKSTKEGFEGFNEDLKKRCESEK
jgi:hypothetical protein